MGQPNPFQNPAPPGGGGTAPKIYELAGCLVAFSPTRFTAAGTGDNLTGFGKDAPRDRITTDIYLLETPNGQPITIGRSSPTDAPTDVVAAPARFSAAWMSADNIVRALAPGGQALVGAMILGRVVRSEVGNKPWNLMSVEGTPDMARAIAIWSSLQMGQSYNEPTPLNPPAQANVVQYGAPAPQYAPSPVTPQPTAWNGQPPAPPVPQPPQPPTVPAHLQALGWTPAAWAGLTPEQQGQVLAATPVSS